MRSLWAFTGPSYDGLLLFATDRVKKRSRQISLSLSVNGGLLLLEELTSGGLCPLRERSFRSIAAGISVRKAFRNRGEARVYSDE